MIDLHSKEFERNYEQIERMLMEKGYLAIDHDLSMEEVRQVLINLGQVGTDAAKAGEQLREVIAKISEPPENIVVKCSKYPRFCTIMFCPHAKPHYCTSDVEIPKKCPYFYNGCGVMSCIQTGEEMNA